MNTTDLAPPIQRIDKYISHHTGIAMSDVYTQAKETGEAVKRHGFTASSNARYLDFLETFRDCPEFAADYQERYPACRFLPWRAFHLVRMNLRLHLDLPKFYAGAVPESQVPWMDAFDLEPEDRCPASEMSFLIGSDIRNSVQLILDKANMENYLMMAQFGLFGFGSFSEERKEKERLELEARKSNLLTKVSSFEREFCDSFFVLAPHEAFITTDDFIKRAQDLEQEAIRATTPPNDPLVVRFVKRGCLVVAAWGDEAAELNKLTADLGI